MWVLCTFEVACWINILTYPQDVLAVGAYWIFAFTVVAYPANCAGNNRGPNNGGSHWNGQI
jgi:hypothetical protein